MTGRNLQLQKFQEYLVDIFFFVAEFFFDNKCLAIMNEDNLPGHHYVDGDHKFVLNFWVEDLEREYRRIRNKGGCAMNNPLENHVLESTGFQGIFLWLGKKLKIRYYPAAPFWCPTVLPYQ